MATSTSDIDHKLKTDLTATDTLFTVLSEQHDPAIAVIIDLLQKGANPNIAIQKDGVSLNALQKAILMGYEQIVELLINGRSDLKIIHADLNAVNTNFETTITIASKAEKLANKSAMMKLLLTYRKLFDIELFDTFVYFCANHLRRQSDPTESDFALLAHYASRLCGVNIGELLNHDHNDDRYLVHLAQYSYAEKDKDELEGWSAGEFLPVRIFSLFEILVKLKQGTIKIDGYKKDNWMKLLSMEILTEIETFKIEQERRAIRDSDLNEANKNLLYRDLADYFINKIFRLQSKEFCLASGYRGHVIYIAFKYEQATNKLTIRYDNLGRGRSRHELNHKEEVYPFTIEIARAEQQKTEIVGYIYSLFELKNRQLERDRHNPKYDEDRKKAIEEIYNAHTKIKGCKHIAVKPKQAAMQEQSADTCAATSHQVGLLSRLEDKSFYDWVVAEEKRCIVQINRTAGSRLITRPETQSLWEIDSRKFESPEFVDCCAFIEDVKRFIGTQPFCEIVKEVLHTEDKIREIKELIQVDDFAKLKVAFQERTRSSSQTYEDDLINMLVALKLGVFETTLIEKFQYLEYSRSCLKVLLEEKTSHQYNQHLCSYLTPFYYYFSGIIYYTLNQLDLARDYFKFCAQQVDHITSYKPSSSVSSLLSGYDYDEMTSSTLPFLKKRSKIALGFVLLEKAEYDASNTVFEQTCIVTDLLPTGRNGMRIYETQALFGLMMVAYKKGIVEANIERKKELFAAAMNKFYTFNTSQHLPFYNKAEEYMRKIIEELSKLSTEVPTQQAQREREEQARPKRPREGSAEEAPPPAKQPCLLSKEGRAAAGLPPSLEARPIRQKRGCAHSKGRARLSRTSFQSSVFR